MGIRTTGLVVVTVLLAAGDVAVGEMEVLERLLELLGPAGGSLVAVGWFWHRVSERARVADDAKALATANKKALDELQKLRVELEERVEESERAVRLTRERYSQLRAYARVLEAHVEELKQGGRALQLALKTDSEKMRDEFLLESSAVFSRVTPRYHEQS